jgi:hypothetical protein
VPPIRHDAESEDMIRLLRVVAASVSCVALCACGGSSGAPGDGSGEAITGAERFGWEQPALDAGELASFRYAMYVDNIRTDAADVSCGTTGASGRFACTCQLPQMASGSHALQVAAFVSDAGATRESARSETVRVVKQ